MIGSENTETSARIVPVYSHRSFVEVVVLFSSGVKSCPHSGQVGVSSGIRDSMVVISDLLRDDLTVVVFVTLRLGRFRYSQ